MEKVAAKCPMCHNKRHGLDKCGYAFRAGFVCTHNPEKAAAQLAALNLGRRQPAKTADERPSASLARASPAPPPPNPPSRPAPALAPPQLPPQPPTASSDVTEAEVRAAAAEITEGYQVSGAADFELITDDEASLVEASVILSPDEASNSKTSVTPCSAVASTSTVCLGSTNKLCLGQTLMYVNPLEMI